MDETTITQYVGTVNPSKSVKCYTLTSHAFQHYDTKFSYGKASALNPKKMTKPGACPWLIISMLFLLGFQVRGLFTLRL
jgi:hypothetical protein